MKVWVFIFCVFLMGCKEENKVLVNLSMGVEIDDFMSNSPVDLSSDCMKKLELCFHEFRKRFSSSTLPDVNILLGETALRFENVVALSIIDDRPRTAGKLDVVELTLRGVPSYSEISIAKDFAYGVIADILSAGWKRHIFRHDPRISGSESEKFERCVGQGCEEIILTPPRFDPYYKMSDEQWQVDRFYNWYFVKDNYYLKFSAWSSRDEKYPVGQASYLFSVDIKSEKEFWLGDFESKDKGNWLELLPEKLERYRFERQVSEENAERAGVKIDRTYQDAPISALGE